MTKEQWLKIIEHQAKLRMEEKGLRFDGLSIREKAELRLEIALDLLCELGE